MNEHKWALATGNSHSCQVVMESLWALNWGMKEGGFTEQVGNWQSRNNSELQGRYYGCLIDGSPWNDARICWKKGKTGWEGACHLEVRTERWEWQGQRTAKHFDSFALGCPVATAIMTQLTRVHRPCGFHHLWSYLIGFHGNFQVTVITSWVSPSTPKEKHGRRLIPDRVMGRDCDISSPWLTFSANVEHHQLQPASPLLLGVAALLSLWGSTGGYQENTEKQN